MAGEGADHLARAAMCLCSAADQEWTEPRRGQGGLALLGSARGGGC